MTIRECVRIILLADCLESGRGHFDGSAMPYQNQNLVRFILRWSSMTSGFLSSLFGNDKDSSEVRLSNDKICGPPVIPVSSKLSERSFVRRDKSDSAPSVTFVLLRDN